MTAFAAANAHARKGGLGCLARHGPEFYRRIGALAARRRSRIDVHDEDQELPRDERRELEMRVAVARRLTARGHGVMDLDRFDRVCERLLRRKGGAR
jgi:hypothetical protein